MAKRVPGEEIFEDGDQHIRLVADFSFLTALNSMGRDVSLVYSDLASGLMPVNDVRNIIMCAAVDIEESKKKDFVEDLITRYGIQECTAMAQIMLSHAMIGDVKKSQLGIAETVQGITDSYTSSPSMSLRKVGLLWTVNCLISTAAVCLIFNVFGKHIA